MAAIGRSYPLTLTLQGKDVGLGPLLGGMASRINALADRAHAMSNRLASLSNQSGLHKLTPAFRGARSEVSSLNDALSTTLGRLKTVGYAVAGAGGIGFLFKRTFVDILDKADRLQISLESIEGSKPAANLAGTFIEDFARKTPFGMDDVSQGWANLRLAGMAPEKTKSALSAIANSVARAGGNSDEFARVAMAVSQMQMAGRVGGNDVLQMLNARIPIWGLLQRAALRTGRGEVSVADLKKASETGGLGPQAIADLLDQMEIEGRGSFERMSKTAGGMFQSLSDRWEGFVRRVGRTGAFDKLLKQLDRFLKWLDKLETDGTLQRWAEKFGQKLSAAFDWLAANGPQILNAIWVNLTRLVTLAEKTAAAFGGWENLITVGFAAYIGGPLLVAVAKLAVQAGKVATAFQAARTAAAAAGVAQAGASVAGAAGAGIAGAGAAGAGAGAGAGLAALGPAALLAGGVGAALLWANWKSEKVIEQQERDLAWKMGPKHQIPEYLTRPRYLSPAVAEMGESLRPTLSPEQSEALLGSLATAIGEPGAPASPQKVKIEVDFNNIPRGTVIRAEADKGLPLSMNRGYTMANSY